ncbi:uncharacterized protein Dwil_GK16191 [Drosophila willistoni]|uniref:Uncharacterized protein n=1 Tax=Drosophila willistoni TaxID=7260 RepID=B4N222_DROWI|nr:uncharacterized protein Dwil_GK16191 [Drosophila willistoni]
MGDNALNVTKANFEFNTTTTTFQTTTEQTTKATTTLKTTNIYSPVVHLLDLEQTVAPPINSGHDGEKFTRKKQLQQENYPTTRPTTFTTTTIESEMERIPTSPTTSTTTTLGTTTTTTTSITPKPKHNGYLGPIFMGEKTFSVLHPLKKPKQEPPSNDNNNNNNKHVSSIESQLRNGRIVEILAPTALLEQNTADSTIAPPTAPPASLAASSSSLKLSTTVFQVAADMQTSTSTATSGPAEETLASLQAQLPPRTESKISDIQIEVYDSTVDSIVASTNFRDNEGYYARPAMDVGEAEETGMGGTTKPPTQPMIQERFTQYVIDRADVSTQPAAGLGKQVPAAIEIHINVSEALGGESEDLEFSYRQPSNAPNEKSSKLSDEILVVEIIDNGDNSTENSASGSAEHINPIFTFRSDAAIATPQVRPPQLPQDAQDELFMADVKGDVPRPPPPPPPPPPRKPSAIDRDSDTIFYISNTEVKVGESLPTVSSAGATLEQQQQRKMQLENQFFPANYMMERTSVATPRYEEDIILSPLHHNAADTLKIFRSGSSSGNTGDGAPPLDVTYVGESVIEVEQQSPAASQSTTMRSLPSSSSPMPDIIIQPAVLPDLAIGVPVIGELPPQIELKEIDYMPGELGLSPNGIGIYENEIQGNSLTMDTDSESEPDVIESSIQYGGDLIDDGAGGGFDGVEGSYPFDSPAHRMQQAVAPHHHHLHRENEPMAEMLNATLLQHNDSGAGASAMAPLLANGSQMPERMGNATALSEDPSNDFDGFLNLFAVSMGLIIVILPSALLVSMYCAVRYMLNKNTATGAQGDDSEQGQDSAKNESPSSPSASSASSGREAPAIHTIHRHHQQVMAHCVQPIRFQFEQDTMIKTIDPALSVIRDTVSDDNVDDPLKIIGPYGSITKMTLKDNHLIIVTEERHDISRNARETKMHTDKDGVFVVEVARGIDSKQMPPDSPGVLETTELPFDTKQQANGLHVLNEQSLPPSHEQVQIHAPPIDFANSQPASAIASMVGGTSSTLHLIEEEEQQLNDPELESDQNLEQEKIAQTGLSQSDLSSTSSGDSNKRYTYGNQELYIIEQPGYATISPTAQPIIPNPSPPTEEVSNNNNEKEQEQQPAEEAEPQIEPKPEPKPQAEPQRQSETQTETLENIAVPPAAFGNYHQADETDDKGDLKQEENTYDSLMSLPAPPSTEEIKELNDFTLIESNQLDSLPPPPPPPPPPPTDANGNGHAKTEEQFDAEAGATIGNGNGNDNATSKVVVPVASVSVCVTQPSDEPTTLTPPASPPATPPPQPPATIYGSGNGQLTNGIIHPMPVDVNGS